MLARCRWMRPRAWPSRYGRGRWDAEDRRGSTQRSPRTRRNCSRAPPADISVGVGWAAIDRGEGGEAGPLPRGAQKTGEKAGIVRRAAARPAPRRSSAFAAAHHRRCAAETYGGAATTQTSRSAGRAASRRGRRVGARAGRGEPGARARRLLGRRLALQSGPRTARFVGRPRSRYRISAKFGETRTT